MFSAEFSFKDCCEQDDFYNTISDSKNHDDKYNQGFKILQIQQPHCQGFQNLLKMKR